jgi:hypothetical protein
MKKCNIIDYTIHYISLEEVKMPNHFSKQTVILKKHQYITGTLNKGQPLHWGKGEFV